MNMKTQTRNNIISGLFACILTFVLICVKQSPHFGAVFVSNQDGEAYNLPIIMYHSVLDDKNKVSKYVITPETLRNDIAYLKENGFTPIVTKDLVEFCHKGTPLPQNPIILTFDDGYFNNYSYVYPILKELQVKGVLSVVGIYADSFSKQGEILNNNYSHATWEQIKEMSGSGYVEIQNHSYDMHDLSRRKGILKLNGEDEHIYKETLIKDFERNKKLIEKATGKTPLAYTYPFGAVNERAKTIIEDLGVQVTYGCAEGINVITKNKECLFDLKRYNRDGRKETVEFYNKILRIGAK